MPKEENLRLSLSVLLGWNAHTVATFAFTMMQVNLGDHGWGVTKLSGHEVAYDAADPAAGLAIGGMDAAHRQRFLDNPPVRVRMYWKTNGQGHIVCAPALADCHVKPGETILRGTPRVDGRFAWWPWETQLPGANRLPVLVGPVDVTYDEWP